MVTPYNPLLLIILMIVERKRFINVNRYSQEKVNLEVKSKSRNGIWVKELICS